MSDMCAAKPITWSKDGCLLQTESTAYLLRLTDFGHLEHVHYGGKVRAEDAGALCVKRTVGYGDAVLYDPRDREYCLSVVPLEWSGTGRGDYRESPLIVRYGEARSTTDFRYVSHQIAEGDLPMRAGLPQSYGAEETLAITLQDEAAALELRLYYAVYPAEDVISRRAVLANLGSDAVSIRKFMSFCMDLSEGNLEALQFSGSWAHEMNPVVRKVRGTLTHGSRAGFSSSLANPGWILMQENATEDSGKAWGMNLVYSGNHYSSVSSSFAGTVRVMQGIQPEGFQWDLGPGEQFETPEEILTYSGRGLAGISDHFQDFVNAHIVRGSWRNRERPVLVNSWEAFSFSYNQKKLISLAKAGKELGAELFVLDDGWFAGRKDDTAGLGDYEPDRKKLPQGVRGLSDRIHQLGMKFGIWVEPEAVNPDSELYRAHPEWALEEEGRKAVYGRNELLLDLSKEEVREYIVEKMSGLIRQGVDYVKWDMNRQLAGITGEHAHRYILGLYEVLGRIFEGSDVLLETCSSGGNRFDLGMLCFSPQIWASDDTDPIERQRIQKSCSYLYPLSCIGAHVADSPSAQTLRAVPLPTRFNTAAFGVLGYELDLASLSRVDKEEIKKQIRFYKKYRKIFQYGRFRRYSTSADGREEWMASDGKTACAAVFRPRIQAAPPLEKLYADGLEEGIYAIESVPQKLRIRTFGRLVSYALPVRMNAEGFALSRMDRILGVDDAKESYQASASALQEGIGLANVFTAAGYNAGTRIPGEYGSEMYVIRKKGEEGNDAGKEE